MNFKTDKSIMTCMAKAYGKYIFSQEFQNLNKDEQKHIERILYHVRNCEHELKALLGSQE